MKESRLTAAAVAALLLVGCAKNDKAGIDSSAMVTQTAMTPAPIALAQVAGKWQMRSVPESGTDTTPTNYVLTATADTTGWMITFASGTKVKVHVSTAGDSLMMKSDEYSSQRRKGVKVMTEGSMRLQGGKIVGMTTAHYKSAKDSVLRLRVEGSKIP
jgi:major membrane immunogen (membrane-anchored lipoprotein)